MRNNIAKVRYVRTIPFALPCSGWRIPAVRLGLAALMQLANAIFPVAENALKQEEKKPQYSLQLLKIVAEQSIPVQTRLAASLAFKNFVRLNYVVCHRYGYLWWIEHMSATADAN